MAKNVTVIDAQGTKYEATYPKRAKGLVRNGRARFVNETTICLAYPPSYTEGKRMNDNGNSNEILEEITGNGKNVSMAYIMEKIDQILADSQYIKDAIAQFKMSDGKAEGAWIGLGNMAESREKTNQALIRLLEKMLDQLGQTAF